MLSSSDISFAERLFQRPLRKYPYDKIVTGVRVLGRNGRLRAVDRNTFRGFYKIWKDCPGASIVFRDFMLQRKDLVIQSLKSISSRDNLDLFSHDMAKQIRNLLTNIRQKQLSSYNKVRKPVELYMEHLVAMALEFNEADRDRLVPLLFLPLDSWIMGSESVFSTSELSRYGLSRASTSSSVGDKRSYVDLQNIASENAIVNGRHFPPIYFDLIWGERYLRREAGNLFESNPL